MISIRWPRWFLNRLRQKKRGLKSVNKGAGPLNICSQIANSNLLSNGFANNQQSALCAQGYANQPVNNAQRGSFLKINEGGMRNIGNVHSGAFGQGFGIAHRQLLLLIDENGEAYDMAGRKWSLAA